MHWGYGWPMAGMWFWWVFVLAVLVFALFWIATAASRRNRPPEDSPEKIVKQRYAKGEIDRQTYDRMLTDLRK